MNFQSLARYPRLLACFARFSLIGEMVFRGNYLMKVVVELLWLGLVVLFYKTLLQKTENVAGWTEFEYLFFVGCYYAVDGTLETLFLSNLGEFAEMVRSGDLDVVLLAPIDEQFMISCRRIEWASAPNVLAGFGIMAYSLVQLGWVFDPVRIAVFGLAFIASIGLAYGFLLMLASTAVWLVRNQSLYEMWWLFNSLMRYPKEIWNVAWAAPIGFVLTFLIPVLLVVNVPAHVMVKILNPLAVAGLVLASVAVLVLSRWVFRRALASYRSASS